MASTSPPRRRSLLAAVALSVLVLGCDTEALDPDLDPDETDDIPPATDSTTRNPPTISQLPITPAP